MIKSILLVDDEEEIVNFLEHFLKRFKIPSIKVTSGFEALNIYDKERIDFVFLDIQLKDIDGFEVLKQLKKKDPQARVIMLTGKSEKDFQDKAKRLGAIDYITKPLDLSDLKDKINKYLLE